MRKVAGTECSWKSEKRTRNALRGCGAVPGEPKNRVGAKPKAYETGAVYGGYRAINSNCKTLKKVRMMTAKVKSARKLPTR